MHDRQRATVGSRALVRRREPAQDSDRDRCDKLPPRRLVSARVPANPGAEIDAVDPLPVPAPAWRDAGIALGALLLLGGVSLLFVCIRSFRKAGTNVPTNRPAMTLVTTGPHGLSRNPIYLSLLAIYLGFGLLLDNGWVLILALPLLLLMEFGVIRREERYLEAKFGEPYRGYRRRVRHWI